MKKYNLMHSIVLLTFYIASRHLYIIFYSLLVGAYGLLSCFFRVQLLEDKENVLYYSFEFKKHL